MGCGQSKFDTELVNFCKERKGLIKASRDSWHFLSHAHMAYVQSMQNVGNEIRNFTMEALVIRFKSPLDTVVSVYETAEEIPQSDDSSLESIEDDGDLDPSHFEFENASDDVFSEEESITVLEQPQTSPSNVTSFIDKPHNRYSNILLNYYPDNSYFPQTRNAEVYNSRSFDFPHNNQIPFDDLVHSMYSPSDLTDQQRSFQLSEDTTWENINPFNSFEENYPNLYFQGTYETNLGESNEVRQREGIPDLEDELCDPLMDVFSTEEESKARRSEHPNDHLSGEVNGHDFHPNETEVQEASERQCSSPQVDESEQNATPTPIYGSTNLQDVLARIKEAFDATLIHGKDVSGMLMPFEPHVTLIKRSASKRTSILRRLLLQKRTYIKLKHDYNEEYGKETDANLFSISWSLEKLYTWEKKLYDELKDEEKLSEIFEKEQEKLKKLDNSGAVSVKIDACQSSLKRVTHKMDVSLSKIEKISAETREIRRDELQPQLCAYISGLQKLSKLSFESQQKQVQAINNSVENIDAITCKTNASSQRVTKKLETEVIKLETSFICWIKSHKEFVVLLKKWLLKFQDQSEVPDWNPLNASTICEDWLNALEKVSHVDVTMALKGFTLVLRQLSQNLHQEKCYRVKLAHFSNYHEQKLKRLCTENGVNYEQCKFLYREAELIGGISGESSVDAIYTRLRPVREKVREAYAKHGEAMNRLNEIANGIFQNGFIPVLAAFENFNLEMFTAYEQVRILNE